MSSFGKGSRYRNNIAIRAVPRGRVFPIDCHTSANEVIRLAIELLSANITHLEEEKESLERKLGALHKKQYVLQSLESMNL